MRIATLLLLALIPAAGRAGVVLHTRSSVYGCSAPQETWAMDGHAPRAEAARLVQQKRCFLAGPEQRWSMIAERDGLWLLRRTPFVAGEPPLFFRPHDLASPGGRTVDDASEAQRNRAFLLASVLLLPVWWIIAGRGAWGERATRRALRIAGAEIAAQQGRLQVRKKQLVIPDPYGSRDLARWNREKTHFCNSRIRRLLAAQGLASEWPRIARRVYRMIERAASRRAASGRLSVRGRAPRFDPGMDPAEYENHCATLLRKAGWEAEVTGASGDQGTDVLARRGKRSLVVQCKLYSKPVGNSAVQQVAAARAHHRADFAAVVSNADYTPGARQLAATNNVFLLHHDELRDFQPQRRRTRAVSA